MSNLYIVSTPIGNLEDITLRALRILKEVDLILCEDTRVTKKLLNHYEIKSQTLSYPADYGRGGADAPPRLNQIITLLKEGKNLALVTDAGTPSISDPGSRLISEIKKELEDVKIISIPGPSAFVSAFSISGVLANEFTFYGFLPHKKGRETLFKKISSAKEPSIFYESPHRILKTLDALNKFCPERKIVIAREITKMYEEVLEGTALQIKVILEENPIKQKGEFVVIVS